jgi:uncharacterized membrane protein YeaQ/YmgE (transglycosylase-associated protein family)
MGLIVTLLLGALIGYIAAHLMGRQTGFWGSMLIGVIGAFVGGVISRFLGVGDQAILAFDLSGLLWSLGGSIVVVAIYNVLTRDNTGL